MATMEVQSFSIGVKRYVLRFTRCGKANCWCRSGSGGKNPAQPGHGPYWYVEVSVGGRTRRRYIGKELKLDGQDKLPT